MYRITSKIIFYQNGPYSEVLQSLAQIFNEIEIHSNLEVELIEKEKYRSQIYSQIKQLLVIATDFGFNHNLWHNYLTFLLMTNENPFSITCEKEGAREGSVNHFAKNDFQAFIELFQYDFTKVEKLLEIDCFTLLQNYNAIQKKELMYNRNVSDKVIHLSSCLSKAENKEQFFSTITDFYRDYGVGMFGLNKAFRIVDDRITNSEDESFAFVPINNMDQVVLEDLVGYELQKKKLLENTVAFVEGRKANNALLFGDSGTGKSTSIKAIVNEFYDQGLRMIEIYKHQFKELSNVIATILTYTCCQTVW